MAGILQRASARLFSGTEGRRLARKMGPAESEKLCLRYASSLGSMRRLWYFKWNYVSLWLSILFF